jgi:hypothetical protein
MLGQNSKCCNGDCAQGRDCPHKENAMSIGEMTFAGVFLVVLGTLTAFAFVTVWWWVITGVMMIVEVLK